MVTHPSTSPILHRPCKLHPNAKAREPCPSEPGLQPLLSPVRHCEVQPGPGLTNRKGALGANPGFLGLRVASWWLAPRGLHLVVQLCEGLEYTHVCMHVSVQCAFGHASCLPHTQGQLSGKDLGSWASPVCRPGAGRAASLERGLRGQKFAALVPVCPPRQAPLQACFLWKGVNILGAVWLTHQMTKVPAG